MVAGGSRLSAILRKWDSGSRPSRMRQLDDFLQRCQHMTGPQLEEELESGASLLLARISSWLRLSYALGHSVAMQLRAIFVFVGASSGQRFLAEFVEVGGVATVVEILALQQIPEDDKRHAIRLLSSVASAGRHYKEIVCESAGVEALHSFMRASKSEELLEEARDLLVAIGRGNPRFSSKVHGTLLELLSSESPTTQRLACAGLRALLMALPSSQLYTKGEDGVPKPVLTAEYCRAAVSLLGSFNLQLLYEAGLLFTVLLSIEQLEEPLLRCLLQLLIDAVDPRKTVPLHEQASAARSLGQLVASLPAEKRDRYTDELELVPWLCTLLVRDSYSPECQKGAVQSLQLLGLCDGPPLDAIKATIGDAALGIILDSSDAVQAALALTSEHLAVARPKIEEFLALHRRNVPPEPLHTPDEVQALLEGGGEDDDAAVADDVLAAAGLTSLGEGQGGEPAASGSGGAAPSEQPATGAAETQTGDGATGS